MAEWGEGYLRKRSCSYSEEGQFEFITYIL